MDLHRFCQQTTGDLFRQWTTQAGGINAGNHATANVFYQRRMAITQELDAVVRFLKPIFAMTSITILTVRSPPRKA